MREPLFTFGERIEYGEKVVGRYARELSGERVVVLWKVYHKYQESYSTSIGLLDKIDDDVDTLYMFDKDTKELFKFQRKTYEKHPTNPHDEDQKSPHIAHNIGHWENGDEIVEQFSMVS